MGFGVSWAAVTSRKRLGGGILGNKEDAAKEWNGGKLGGGNEVCRGTWRVNGVGMREPGEGEMKGVHAGEELEGFG